MRTFTMNDYKELCGWFRKRNFQTPPAIFLPPTGLITPDVAAGFLIRTDCNIGILDFFITNPDAGSHVRAEALEEIARKLILDAQWAGIKAIKCDSKFENIKRLANRLNFTYLGDSSAFFKGL